MKLNYTSSNHIERKKDLEEVGFKLLNPAEAEARLPNYFLANPFDIYADDSCFIVSVTDYSWALRHMRGPMCSLIWEGISVPFRARSYKEFKNNLPDYILKELE